MAELSRARRFINCYNMIDQALRMQGDMSKSISYTEAIRKAARTNGIVKKYNNPEYMKYFSDKIVFNKKFNKYILKNECFVKL